MKCINCGNKSDNLLRGYCPPCINCGKIPCHPGYQWHKIVNRKDKKIAELKKVISIFKLEAE